MTNQDSSSYQNELNQWLQGITAHFDEIHSIELNLSAIISRNSITDIAAKVEVYQLMLDKIKKRLQLVEDQLKEVRGKISSSELDTKDQSMVMNIRQQFNFMGTEVKKTEHEYDDVRYYCQHFIEETLR
jgi:hypothetical protein